MMEPQCRISNLKIKHVTKSLINTQLLFDYNRLQQVLLNLISNAIKFSLPNGIIEVKSYLDNKKGQIKIKVVDYGLGIVHTELEKIFIPFYKTKQNENLIMNPSGNGLGMYTSRKIC